MSNVYRDGKVHVMAEKCATCIFRPGNLMSLNDGRVRDMVAETVSNVGSNIPCHKTIYGQREQEAVCRGWYDGYADRDFLFRLAKRMDIIEEVAP